MLRVETWKYGWRWVYSVTYDEGVPTLLQHALPLHRKHAMPGTVALDPECIADGEEHRQDANDGEHERYLNLNEVHESCNATAGVLPVWARHANKRAMVIGRPRGVPLRC